MIEPNKPPAFEVTLADAFRCQVTANIMTDNEDEAEFHALTLAQAWVPHHFWKVVETRRLN